MRPRSARHGGVHGRSGPRAASRRWPNQTRPRPTSRLRRGPSTLTRCGTGAGPAGRGCPWTLRCAGPATRDPSAPRRPWLGRRCASCRQGMPCCTRTWRAGAGVSSGGCSRTRRCIPGRAGSRRSAACPSWAQRSTTSGPSSLRLSMLPLGQPAAARPARWRRRSASGSAVPACGQEAKRIGRPLPHLLSMLLLNLLPTYVRGGVGCFQEASGDPGCRGADRSRSYSLVYRNALCGNGLSVSRIRKSRAGLVS